MARNPHASYEASDHQRMPIIPIANNLTTTSAGYALDARQGKALNDKFNVNNIASLSHVFTDKVYGQNGNVINIDRINNSFGYIYRVITGSDFSGTSPISVIGGGNSFLLIGFSQVTANNLIQYGVQIAFGFGGTKIAIRNRNYVASGGEWEAWTAV